MASDTSAGGEAMFREPGDFSLVLGGPLFQRLRRSPLSGNALDLARRRFITIALLAWLPLLVLSVLEGQALCGNVAVPFLLDALLRLVAATLVPLVPLALTMRSLEDLLTRLIGIVFSMRLQKLGAPGWSPALPGTTREHWQWMYKTDI